MFKFLVHQHEERLNSERKFWTKMLPFGAFIGLVQSAVPLLIALMAGWKNFVGGESYAGYMVVTIFSSVFTFTWWVTYLVCLEERYTYYPVHINRDIENTTELVYQGVANKLK